MICLMLELLCFSSRLCLTKTLRICLMAEAVNKGNTSTLSHDHCVADNQHVLQQITGCNWPTMIAAVHVLVQQHAQVAPQYLRQSILRQHLSQ